MTIRNLDRALAPASVALIGASRREGSVGQVVLRNTLASGFAGKVFPVNPKYDEIAGLKCYHRLADLPDSPDVALVMTPAQTVPGVVAELGARGTKAAVILSAGEELD